MEKEIIALLENEGKLSGEAEKTDIALLADSVKRIGEDETEYIKSCEISKDLSTRYIGRELYVYHEVSSTNTIAKFLSQNGASNGCVVISEIQNAGRGRSGKSWQSPLGGVWLSVILNPVVEHSKIPLITLATGVAVSNTLKKEGIENPEIKWPNDILINGRKVCGILTEAVSRFNTIEHVIVGVGIDVNLNLEEFPPQLKDETTTLENELQRKTDENHLIRIFLEEFEKINDILSQQDYEAILKEWRKQSYTIGKTVEVKKPYGKSYEGYVAGISKEGALVVEKNDGSLEKVISGECVIKN